MNILMDAGSGRTTSELAEGKPVISSPIGRQHDL